MVTRIVRAWVFVMPSPNEFVWREEVRRLASNHNISVQDWDGVSEVQGEGIVLTSEPISAPDGWDETAIMSSASSSVDFLQGLGFHYTDAVRRVSQYLSYCAAVQYRNGQVIAPHGEAEYLFQELGYLAPELVAESASSVQPLAMFERCPPEIGSKAHWQPELFAFSTHGRPLALNASPEIDVTGRTRILVFGPQISLSPGEWTIRATIDCDPEGSKNRYFASWGTRDRRTERLIDIDRPGRYDINMSATWDSCTEAEFIICSREPLFTGKLKFLTVDVIFSGNKT